MINRELITKIILGIALAALVGGFLLGLFNKEEDEEDDFVDDEHDEVVDYSKEVQNVSDGDEGDANEVNEEEENPDPHHEDHDDHHDLVIEPQEIDESKLEIPYKEILGEKITKETMKIANDFVKVFYNLDGDKPSEFIEGSKKYMTNDFYKRVIEKPEQPTYDVYKRTYISSEVFEMKVLTKEDAERSIPYIVRVKGETINAENKNKQQVTDVYNVILVKDKEGNYRVDDVRINNLF